MLYLLSHLLCDHTRLPCVRVPLRSPIPMHAHEASFLVDMPLWILIDVTSNEKGASLFLPGFDLIDRGFFVVEALDGMGGSEVVSEGARVRLDVAEMGRVGVNEMLD